VLCEKFKNHFWQRLAVEWLPSQLPNGMRLNSSSLPTVDDFAHGQLKLEELWAFRMEMQFGAGHEFARKQQSLKSRLESSLKEYEAREDVLKDLYEICCSDVGNLTSEFNFTV
jgi:hypothetical protein